MRLASSQLADPVKSSHEGRVVIVGLELGARFKQLAYEAGLFLLELGDLVRLLTHLLPHTENTAQYH